MIKGINLEKFLKHNFLFIENIIKGFENYAHICFFGEYKEIEKYILSLIKEENKAFFDFYYPNLSEQDKEIFLNYISYNKNMDKFYFVENEIYFNAKEIDLGILKFVIKLSFDEILFSTFYFSKFTIWINYNSQIILFFKDKEEFLKQKEKGIIQGLNIAFEKE